MEVDDTDGLEAEAARRLGVEGVPDRAPSDVERCPHCQRPMDDIEDMTEAQLLELGRKELLKALVRSYRLGTNTHQEMAILRGLLRDNSSTIPPEEEPEEDDTLPPVAPRPTPLPSHDAGDSTDYDETAGG